MEAIKNYLSDYSFRQINKLNQREAILASINLIRDIQMNITKSNRLHENSTTIL